MKMETDVGDSNAYWNGDVSSVGKFPESVFVTTHGRLQARRRCCRNVTGARDGNTINIGFYIPLPNTARTGRAVCVFLNAAVSLGA